MSSAQRRATSDEYQHLLRLLHEALELADSLACAPELGARLQELIEIADSSSRRDYRTTWEEKTRQR
jgi:hypothetical protein